MRFCDALANGIKPTSWSRFSPKNTMSDALRAASNALDGEIETCASQSAALLCQFQVRVSDICDNHDIHPTALIDRFEQVNARFENLLNVTETGLIIPHEARPLTRMIAREFDTYSLSDTGHSCAI